MSKKLPADLEIKISSFHKFICESREENESEERFIVNLDETPPYFDIVPGKCIDKNSSKSACSQHWQRKAPSDGYVSSECCRKYIAASDNFQREASTQGHFSTWLCGSGTRKSVS